MASLSALSRSSFGRGLTPVRSCLRSCSKSQTTTAVSLWRQPCRFISQKSGPKPHPKFQKMEVMYPKTRIAVGIVFIGALIYSMVTDDTHKTEAPTVAEQDVVIRKVGIDDNSPMRLRMEQLVQDHQSRIVKALEEMDGGQFRIDRWDRSQGGGGITCVLQDSKIFEKAGVNTSVVYGKLPRAAIQKMRVNHKALDPTVDSLDFFATGLSLVLHPHNPMAPTVHLNYRYFETIKPNGATDTWWFGGGCDLTPSYLFEEDSVHFHQTIKDACDKHDSKFYPRFKKWCDDYFTVHHRGETRGIGGIFFDDLDESEKGLEELFSFVSDCLSAFLPSYLPIVKRRMDMPYTDKHKAWQQLRRGRYVEFNLVHDRGTAFGLHTPGARIESILMSLPLTARWEYMQEPEEGSEEERLMAILKKPVEWV